MRIKAELFPYDQLDVDEGLQALVFAGLIVRYHTNGLKVISIPTWARHQIVSRDEAPSQFEGPNGEIDQLGRAPNETIRQRIYQRDRFVCAYCRKDMVTDARSRCVDHVIPISRGGSHDERNLVTACKKCNAKKASKLPDEAGFEWPGELGHTVNGVLDPRQQGPDKEQEQEGIEEQERIKRSSPEPLRASAPSIRSAPMFLEFPVVGTDGPTWKLLEPQVVEWQTLFPTINVRQESRSALAWIQANLGRRKTAKGMAKFLVSWFTRSLDRGVRQVELPETRQTPAQWSCPHVERCSHRAMCASKTLVGPEKYPVKKAVAS
jgi:hypothetical protein